MNPKLILVSEGEIEMLRNAAIRIQDSVRQPVSWAVLDTILMNTHQILGTLNAWRTYPEWKSPAD